MSVFIHSFFFRHDGNSVNAADAPNEEEEKSKLDKVLKKIERNKKLRQKQKDKEQKIKTAIQKTTNLRQLRREIKSKIVPVPENNDDFIDKSAITEAQENPEPFQFETDNSLKKEKNTKYSKINPEVLKDFTILGADNFTKKTKVLNSISFLHITETSNLFLGQKSIT